MKVSDIDWKNWEPEELSTIMFVVEENRVLLIHKKKRLGCGKNKWARRKDRKRRDSHAMRDKRDQ